MTDILSAEWLKLRSVKSTVYAVGVAALAVLFGALFVWYAAQVWDGRPPERQATFRAAAPEQGFLPLVQMCLAVVAVLAVTTETVAGYVAVPRRRALFAGKAAVVGAVAFGVGLAVTGVTYAVARLLAGDRPMGFNESSFADDVPGLLVDGLSVAIVALLAAALGAIVRSTAGAITTLVVLLFVAPTVANFLPDRVDAMMLPNLVDRLADPGPAELVAPWLAVLLLLAYAAVPLTAALVLAPRRDL